jgi:alkylhydroperoxidase/carboxymuconolactone decarboxylase family protein YurZ
LQDSGAAGFRASTPSEQALRWQDSTLNACHRRFVAPKRLFAAMAQEKFMARPSETKRKKSALPAFAGSIAKRFPRVWNAYAQLGEEAAMAGPLNERERRLVKLGLAIGAGSEGATHSHVRQAISDGLAPAEIRHVALLAITTLGFPSSAAALSWLDDVLPK